MRLKVVRKLKLRWGNLPFRFEPTLSTGATGQLPGLPPRFEKNCFRFFFEIYYSVVGAEAIS